MGAPGPLLRRRALRLPARHHHHGQGPDERLRPDGRRHRLRPRLRALQRGHALLHPRHHLRRAPGVLRRWRWPTSTSSSARASTSTCARTRPALRGDAREPARHPDRRRRARRRLLPGDRARQGPRRRFESFSDEESETLLRGFLSAELYRRGLICRADDRGDPVIQFSPPLIAGPEQFEEIESILRPVLEEASERMHVLLARRCPGAHRRRPAARPRRQPRRRREQPRHAGPLGPHLRAARPDAVAVGRRAAADHRPAAGLPQAPARLHRPPGRPPARRPRAGDGLRPQERAQGARRGGGASATSRSSRCPTTCRSSRSPRRPSPAWSTSSTPCSSARSPRTSASSASCSPSAGSTRSSPRSPA